MAEMTTGQRPFNDYKLDDNLAVMICNFGLRPKFALGTPDCYVELANQCMNSDPEKRPDIRKIVTKLDKWLNIIEPDIGKRIMSYGWERWYFIQNGYENEIECENVSESENVRIKKQFFESDEICKNLPIITEKLNNIYTSKSYNILEIGARLSKIYTTKPVDDVEVLDDY
ncbi:hypothetical protein C2G38_2266218 [Gigaspora rosea]|uniref:Serine-threonine/tyrosine-protein kinase catalytic domain-containing protein n=1 Tax=Gigaspora rosea TaxID=44941 RepID=A0A397UL55_9GLOM|nr:hypothetical protein C2G38_2266218 [Gigaspora rosea]